VRGCYGRGLSVIFVTAWWSQNSQSKVSFHTSLLRPASSPLERGVVCAIAGALGCICNVAALFRLQFVYLRQLGCAVRLVRRSAFGKYSSGCHYGRSLPNQQHSTNSLTLISSARARLNNTFHSLSRVDRGWLLCRSKE